MKLPPEERKQREIVKWEKEQKKSKLPGYLVYFLLVICVVYVCDEVVSQIGTQMQSVVASQLFAPIVGEEFAVARMSALGLVLLLPSALAVVYKPLCDRFGRRPFLIVNTLGMGLGVIFVGIATNIPVYVLGAALVTFFTPHDMQAIYIQECAPPRYRATLYSVIKAVATLGMLMIPMLRSAFMTETDLSGWRYVYLVPGIVTVVVAVVAFFLIKESDAFVADRLRRLRMTEEELANARSAEERAQGGLIPALKLVLRNKQLRWLTVAQGFIAWGMLITSYYEATMTYGYAQQFLAQGIDLEAAKAAASTFVTQALLLFSVGSAVFQFFPGLLADKLGRKKTAIVMTVCVVLTFLGFYFGSSNNWSPYVVGFLCGACIGSYWYTGDLMYLMVSESTPTNLRASVLSAQPLLSYLLYVPAMGAVMLLTNILGDAYIGICVLATILPGMIAGLVLMMLRVRETKGVDMGAVTVE